MQFSLSDLQRTLENPLSSEIIGTGESCVCATKARTVPELCNSSSHFSVPDTDHEFRLLLWAKRFCVLRAQ